MTRIDPNRTPNVDPGTKRSPASPGTSSTRGGKSFGEILEDQPKRASVPGAAGKVGSLRTEAGTGAAATGTGPALPNESATGAAGASQTAEGAIPSSPGAAGAAPAETGAVAREGGARDSASNRTSEAADDRDSDAAAESAAQGQGRTQSPEPSSRPDPTPAQRSADLRALLPKLVETFRIGQNRAGNTEVHMDLKATTAGGMGIRMSQGPGGIQALLLVDQYATKTALEGQIAELTQRLEAQGIRVQEVRVEIESEAPNPRFSPRGGSQGDSGENDGSGDWSEADTEVTNPGRPGSPGNATGPRSGSPAGPDGAEDPAQSAHKPAGSRSRRSRTDYSL